MKVALENKTVEPVRLVSLDYGDAFLDQCGVPYVKLNPNVTCFKITYNNVIVATKTPVLSFSDGTMPVLGHLDRNTFVTPCEAQIIFSGRK